MWKTRRSSSTTQTTRLSSFSLCLLQRCFLLHAASCFLNLRIKDLPTTGNINANNSANTDARRSSHSHQPVPDINTKITAVANSFQDHPMRQHPTNVKRYSSEAEDEVGQLTSFSCRFTVSSASLLAVSETSALA